MKLNKSTSPLMQCQVVEKKSDLGELWQWTVSGAEKNQHLI